MPVGLFSLFWFTETRKASATNGMSLFLGEELRDSLTSSLDMPFAARPNFTTPFWNSLTYGGILSQGVLTLALLTPRIVLSVMSEF